MVGSVAFSGLVIRLLLVLYFRQSILGQTQRVGQAVLWSESIARYSVCEAQLKGWLHASVGVLTNLSFRAEAI